MNLQTLKNRKSEKGFTIVELLIVIVVIAILAAITIVAYGGITSRANTTKAQTNASNTQKVAETFNADAGKYPASAAEFRSGYTGDGNTPSNKLPTSITISNGATATSVSAATTAATTALSATTDTGKTTVYVVLTGASAAAATGGIIFYYDFNDKAAKPVYFGSASSTSTDIIALPA